MFFFANWGTSLKTFDYFFLWCGGGIKCFFQLLYHKKFPPAAGHNVWGKHFCPPPRKTLARTTRTDVSPIVGHTIGSDELPERRPLTTEHPLKTNIDTAVGSTVRGTYSDRTPSGYIDFLEEKHPKILPLIFHCFWETNFWWGDFFTHYQLYHQNEKRLQQNQFKRISDKR